MSDIDWFDFQLRRKFPNTEPGSAHDGIDLACFFCGNVVVQGSDIFEIKRGAIWTNCIPEGIRKDSKRMFNKYKMCNFYNASCDCGKSVGSVYTENFDDCGPGQEFPCVKVTYIREGRDGTLMNSTALNITSEEDVESVARNLTLSKDQAGVSDNGVRMNTKNFNKHRR